MREWVNGCHGDTGKLQDRASAAGEAYERFGTATVLALAKTRVCWRVDGDCWTDTGKLQGRASAAGEAYERVAQRKKITSVLALKCECVDGSTGTIGTLPA